MDDINRLEIKVDRIDESVQRIDTSLALTQQTLKMHTAHGERLDQQIISKLSGIESTLKDNTEDLKEHMRRTAALEVIVENIDTRLNPIEKEKIEKEAVAKVLAEQKAKRISTSKIIAAAATILSAVIGLIKFMGR